MSLTFWLPSRSLVEDLHSRGVTVAATVIDVDTKPNCVEVRFVQGPERGTTVELSQIGGMLPDAHTGESMLVTYVPKDPSRSLTRSWVMALPPNLPAFGTAALAAFFLSGVVAVTLRRRWILRTWPPDSSAADPTQPHKPGFEPQNERLGRAAGVPMDPAAAEAVAGDAADGGTGGVLGGAPGPDEGVPAPTPRGQG